MKRSVILIVVLLAVLVASLYLRSLPNAPGEQSDQLADSAPRFALSNERVSFPLSATTEVPLLPDSTAIYCGTLQLAWNELGDSHLGFPIQFSEESAIADSLNLRLFSMEDIGTKGVLVQSGPGTGKELADLQKKIDEQFPGSKFSLPKVDFLDGRDSWFAFACLARKLEFNDPFERLRPIVFSKSKNQREFEAFGIEQHGSRSDILRKQVLVLHDSEKSFILELKTKSEDEDLILARVPALGTFKETIESALEKIKAGKPKKLGDEDEVIIPLISVNASYSFQEIVGKKIRGREGSEIVEFSQLVQFQLDESGARVESSSGVSMSELNGHRVYIFNNPFLLMIRKKGSSVPYFAMWVGDDTFLVSTKK